MDIEIKELKLSLEKNLKSLDSLTLIAKTEGAVVYEENPMTERKTQVGDNVQATWPVITIPNNTSFKVEAQVNETHIQYLKPGQKVDIVPDAYPDKQFHGEIKDIINSAEKIRLRGKAHYFTAIIYLSSYDRTIMKPGMSVKCVVHTAKIPGVFMIPLEMTYFDGHSFWIKPKNEKALKVNPLGFNEFYLGLRPDTAGKITGGALLESVNPSIIKE
jgi:hypothetical protein